MFGKPGDESVFTLTDETVFGADGIKPLNDDVVIL